jgi:hypothetical protein
MVVDPWVNIACTYGDYAGRLNAKLTEWDSTDDKWIQNPGHPTNNGWVKPLDQTLQMVVPQACPWTGAQAVPAHFRKPVFRTALANGAILTIVGANQSWRLG